MMLFDFHITPIGVFKVMAPDEHHVLAVVLTAFPKALDSARSACVAPSMSQPLGLSFKPRMRVVGFLRASP